MLTNWGYSVDELPPIVSAPEFMALNPGLSSTTGQIMAVLDAVSASVRDWCGWHVAPNLGCDFIGNGEGQLLMLPCMGVSDVETVTVYTEPITYYEWNGAGMIRLTSGKFPRGWRNVSVRYKAGFTTEAIGAVVSQIAANMLVASPGVAEEHVGSAGITYNRTGDGITGGISLLERDRELLAPYKLARAW